MREILSEAWRLFRVLAPMFLGLMLVRGVALGDLGAFGLLGWLALVGTVGIGCVTFAALRPMRRNVLGYLVSCGVAGAVAIVSLVGTVFLVVPWDPYGYDAALARSPLFWGFLVVAGALTGIAYGRIAQDT